MKIRWNFAADDDQKRWALFFNKRYVYVFPGWPFAKYYEDRLKYNMFTKNFFRRMAKTYE